MRRLNQSCLLKLPARVRQPAYDRSRLHVGMAHIGVGAFHRCHQTEFTDDMLEARFGAWGVVGINLRPPRLADILAPQNCLFTRTLRDGPRADTRVLGSIRAAIDVDSVANGEAAIQALASTSLRVATLTVTEKGYCHIPASGALDWENPDLKADVAGDGQPRTVLGLLTRALERRRAAGRRGAMTIISCDNLPSNGELLRSALIGFSAAHSRDLPRWIERNIAFPCSMVDRIVPAATQADVDSVAIELGAVDKGAVIGEPFRQWVIEDRFAGERPPWDLAGVQFVRDARPYELVKMRVLNAAQSMLSYLGAMIGLEFSFEAAEDSVLGALTRRMLEVESATTLPHAQGMETAKYINASLSRVRNREIRHRCHQIASDGSQKIVQRLLNPMRERLAAGQRADLLTLAASSWIAYCLAGGKRFGRRWAPSDPWAEKVVSIADQPGADPLSMTSEVLRIEAIFGRDLASPHMIEAVARHIEGLLSADPRGYLARLIHV